MATLRVITQGLGVSVVRLESGLHTVGRNPANRVCLPEDSVSGFHGEIEVSEAGVHVRDLKSTNGTFIDGRPVTESWLSPGQTLALGNVLLTVDAPAGPVRPTARRAAALADPASPGVPGGSEEPIPAGVPVGWGGSATVVDPCCNHADLPAAFICTRCRGLYCDRCVKTRTSGSKVLRDCPVCRGTCLPVAEYRAQENQRRADAARGFFQRAPGAFSYPFVQGGFVLLLAGTALFLLMDLASFAFGFGLSLIASIVVLVFCAGYLFAYLQRVLVASSQGEERLPPWPEFTDWGRDIVRPFLMLLSTLAVSLGIPIALQMAARAGSGGTGVALPVCQGLLFLGLLYLPMALIAVSISDSLGGLNPGIVFSAIVRVPAEYFIAWMIGVVTVAAAMFLDKAIQAVLSIPVLPSLLSGFVTLYFAIVLMRILGLLYYCKRDAFGWNL